jgi:hypothetical protein
VPAGVVGLLTGKASDITPTLMASPVVRKISLTGSTSVGKQMVKAAADTLKRVTMELGGHAPVIVFDDADAAAVDGTKTASAGRHAAATYVVQEGDSLASIADSLGLDGGWRALYAENKGLIGADPSDIVPGQTLDTGVE